MATLAPYCAKRTAIAWPIPELPPVTSTFLPSRPGRSSARGSAVGVSWAIWMPPSGCKCGLSGRGGRGCYAAAQEHQAGEREEQDRHEARTHERGRLGGVEQPEVAPDRRRRDDE